MQYNVWHDLMMDFLNNFSSCRKEDVAWKFIYDVALATAWSVEDINDTSKISPRALLGTTCWIGAVLDSNYVHLVQRAGISASRLNLMQ